MSEALSREDTIRVKLGTNIGSYNAETIANPLLKSFIEKKIDLTPSELFSIINIARKTPYFKQENFIGMLNDFQEGCESIATILNNIASERGKLTILVPGDSASKIVKYIQIRGLCPGCNFIEFPFSKDNIAAANIRNPNFNRYWGELNSILPNIDLSNLIIIDFINTGDSILNLLELTYKKKIARKEISEKNREIYNKIIDELKLGKDIFEELILNETMENVIKFPLEDVKREIKKNQELIDSQLAIPANRPILKKILTDIVEIKSNTPREELFIIELENFLKRLPVSNIINIFFYFKRMYSSYYYASEEVGKNRCQSRVIVDNLFIAQAPFDLFGCDFFVYVAILYSRNKDQIITISKCNNCQSTTRNISACAGCKKVAYCNEECQRADWRRHKADCKKEGKVEGKVEGKHGGYYGKYLKYKQKYIALKAQSNFV